MHDSIKVFDQRRQAARAVNIAGCTTTEAVAEYCGLTDEGAFVILKQLHREGRISRACDVPALWLPKVARPVDDPQVYAAHQARSRKARETRKNKEFADAHMGMPLRPQGESRRVADANIGETRLDMAGETAASF